MEISPVSQVTATLPNLNPVQLAQAAANMTPVMQTRPARVADQPNSNTMIGAVVQSKLSTQTAAIGPSLPSEKVLKPYGIATFQPAAEPAKQHEKLIH